MLNKLDKSEKYFKMIKNNIKSELPNGWEIASINDLIDAGGKFIDGDWIETKDQDTHGAVRLIQLADIGDGEFKDRSNRYMMHNRALELNCTFLERGDILVARMPDPLGRAVIFPFHEKEKYVTVVDIAIIRTGKNILNKYLMYFINSPEIRKQINALQTGTTRKRISRNNLGQIKIPVPPLEEQYRIVEKLEELFSELDQVTLTLEKSRKQLEIFRESLLNNAFRGNYTANMREANIDDTASQLLKEIEIERETKFEQDQKEWEIAVQNWIIAGKKGKLPQKPKKYKHSFLNESEKKSLPALPSAWMWIKIAAFEELVSSGSTPKGGKNVYTEEGIQFIRSQNIYPNHLKLNDVAFIDIDTHNKMSRSKLKGKDVLLNITGASIGRCAFLPEYFGEGNVNQHVCIIRPFTNKVNYQFISWYLNSPVAQKLINNINSGATREALNFEQIRNFPFPLVPLKEQIEISQIIDEKISIADNLKSIIKDSLSKTKILHQTILKTAYNGALIPQDKADRTAVELLKDIRESKAKSLANRVKIKRSVKQHKPMGNSEKDIIQVLRDFDRPATAKEVWEKSKHNHDIEAFYYELKNIQDRVQELEKGILSLKK